VGLFVESRKRFFGRLLDASGFNAEHRLEMRIFINALSLSNAYGIGRYTRTLLAGLVRIERSGFEICVFARENEFEGVDAGGAFRLICPRMPGANRLFLEHVELPAVLARLMPHVYFSPDFTLPYVLKVKHKLVTIHDLLVFSHPESISARARMLYRAFIPRSVKQADILLTDSRATKSELIELFPFAEEKVRVLYPALDPFFQDEPDETDLGGPIEIADQSWLEEKVIPEPFILYVGSFSPRKNVKALSAGFAELHGKYDWPGSLVMIGGDGSMHKPDNGIFDMGFQDDSVIRQCYRRAAGLVLISSGEGFGYPVLEALACGCPALITRSSAMSEISPGKKGVIEIDPEDAGEIKAGIIRLIEENESLRSGIDTGVIVKRFSAERLGRGLLDAATGTQS